MQQCSQSVHNNAHALIVQTVLLVGRQPIPAGQQGLQTGQAVEGILVQWERREECSCRRSGRGPIMRQSLVAESYQQESCCCGSVVFQQGVEANVFHERFRWLHGSKYRLVGRERPNPLHVGPRVTRVDGRIPCKRMHVSKRRFDQAGHQSISGGVRVFDFAGSEGDNQPAIEGGEVVMETVLTEDGVNVVHVILRCVWERGVQMDVKVGKVGVLRVHDRGCRDVPFSQGWRGDREIANPLPVLGVVERLEGLDARHEMLAPVGS